jgi:hypothetical protein
VGLTLEQVGALAPDAAALACTPDAFPDMIAAALGKRDVGQWASERGIVGAR